MQQALSTVNEPVDYINTHGTSTPVGDLKEIQAIGEVYSVMGRKVPPLSSTKSLTGHSLGAAGVHEAIYSLLMMEHNFIAASANAGIEEMDEAVADMPIVTSRMDEQQLNTVMTNNFGFGGTNACLVMQKYS